MTKYRKIPVVIEAIQFINTDEGRLALIDFAGSAVGDFNGTEVQIRTLEDGEDFLTVKHIATVGDYIIRGVAGEYYACKPDIFKLTYEEVEE